METRTYTVYTFDELPKEAQEKALERYRYWNIEDPDWYDSIFDSLASSDNEDLTGMGCEYISCSFSGFYSQGDGASVEYELVDIEKFAKATLSGSKHLKTLRRVLKWCPDTLEWGKTEKYSSYSSYTNYAPIRFDINNKYRQPVKALNALCNALDKASKEHHERLCRETYRALKDDYDYLTSDECLQEFFQEADYLFTIDGKID